MKYLPKKAVKQLLKTMLYSNKPVYLDEDVDRRPNNRDDDNIRTDPNLTYWLKELKDYIFEKHVYRIPVGLIVDLGLVNFAMKTDTKILITLKRDLNKLFETTVKAAHIPSSPNAVIFFYDRPYISYQELNLTQTADIYLMGILRSQKALRQGILPSPYQQLFEISTDTKSFTCTFKGAQRQFDWLKISLVYGTSYQHTTIYDSYDLELEAKLIQNIKLENTSTTYNITGKLFLDLEKDDDKNILYKMLVTYQWNCCSSAFLTQYKNNPIYQEMTEEDEFTTNEKDDGILIDMRQSKSYTDELEKLNHGNSELAPVINLKKTAAKKLRLRVTGFSQAKYWYILSCKGYIISYKNCNISKADEI